MQFKQWDINLKIRLIGEAFVQISFWTVFPFLAIYFANSFGSSTASFLLIFSQVLAVICGLLGGFFADRYGRRRMMLIAILGETVGYGIFALASYEELDSAMLGFIGFTLASLFSSLYQPAAQAMIADVVEAKHRSYVFSVFYMMTNIAVVIGPLIGSVFFIKNRFELLLFVTLGAGLLFFLLYKFSHETAPMVVSSNNSQSGPISLKNVLLQQVRDYRIIFKDRVLLLFIVAGILVSQTFMQLDLFIPIHITETISEATLFHFGEWSFTLNATELFGLIVAINGGIVALLTVSITKWMMNYSEKFVFASSSILYAVSILFMGLFPYAWNYIVCIIIFSLAELMTVGIQQNFVTAIAPSHQRGMYFSAAQLRFSIGRVLAPLSITFTAFLGSKVTTFILALIALIAAFIYIKMYNMYQRKISLSN
jgi:MFS family permease